MHTHICTHTYAHTHTHTHTRTDFFNRPAGHSTKRIDECSSTPQSKAVSVCKAAMSHLPGFRT